MEVLIPNVPNPQLIRANREDLPTTGEFTYTRATQLNMMEEQTSCALSTLVCGSECWRMTEGDPYRWSVFQSLLKFCVRHSALWFARWTQQCLVVKKCEKL